MPLHLNSIINDSQNSDLLAWFFQHGMDEYDSLFITDDKKYLHIQRSLVDMISSETIGRLIYTIKFNHERKALEVLDLDIVMDNSNGSLIRFIRLRAGSSDSNEYYEIETVGEEQHLEIETVNRHTEPKEILGTERKVYVSLFPFELSVYEDINAFNKWAGFSNPIESGKSGIKVHGLSERFCMPGGITNPNKKEDESYSFVVGRVKSFNDVAIQFGEYRLSFVLAKVDTALGLVPVAMGRDVFDLSKLKVGCIVAMNADVKVDVSEPSVFKRTK